jgi:hypothetical protein
MKKLYIISVLFLSALLYSCNSILDKNPLDTFTNDNFWTAENNVKGYANSFYNDFSGYDGDFYYPTLNDDQAGSGFTDWSYTSIPASSSNWNGNWTEIRRADIMLEKIPGISSMTIEAKNHWLGFARLMRAWTYYDLVRMYGDVPWVNKSLDINDNGTLYGKRIDRDVVMDSIRADLNYACTNMRNNTSRTTLNQAVAYAMKAEICLYEGTFCKYRSSSDGQKAADATRATAYLTEAQSACSALMSNSNYALNSSYQGNYNSVDLSSNKEMILYKAYKQDVMMHSLIAYTCSSSQMSGLSKDAFDSYLFSDGKPLGLTSYNKNDAAYIQIGTKMVAGVAKPDTVMNLNKVLAVRDKRLTQTIDTALCYVSRTFVRFNTGMAMTSSTGYGVAKFDNQSISLNYRNQGGTNYTHAPLFWMAVIYLDYAESCAELGSITQTDLDNSINKLKARAGLPNLKINPGFSDPANNAGVSDLIWEIRRERRCELMFDNNFRYWDLIRWHQLNKLDSSQNPNILKGANIVNDPYDLKISRTGNYINSSQSKTRTFNNKYYLYPIPSGQISLNPQLTQNYGWTN